MAYPSVPGNSFPNPSAGRPDVTTYDSAYEHSVERYVDAKMLSQAADGEALDVPATYAQAS